jgi:Grx4 family monothiol glutaredoxin
MDRVDGGEDVAAVTQYYSKLVNAVTSNTSSSMIQTESLSSQQPRDEATSQSSEQILNNRLRSIITSSPIMLFLKGTPNAPRCGFSRQAVELLTSSNVSFAYFDILEDDEVRQGLKVYSDWPTFPQFYVRGELVGGLDIMKELMEEEGGLVEQLDLHDFVIKNSSGISIDIEQKEEESQKKKMYEEVSINERLKQLVSRHRIMLFMKGIPSSPRCGFSRQIVEILDSFHVSYDAFNILEDDDVREGLKKYSDWPTYPQLYVEGDLVGGLDIVTEMLENGELEELLRGNDRD